MKSLRLLLLFSLTGCHILSGSSQSDPFIKDFLERWENSTNYMIAVAEAMPEEFYDFKPSPEEMTFAEQLLHIAAVIEWHAFSRLDGQDTPFRKDDFLPEGKSKQEMIKMTMREFDKATNLIADFDPVRLDETGSYAQFTRTRRQFLLLLADHVSHHRGQMLVYLRMKGITPPNYIDYQ